MLRDYQITATQEVIDRLDDRPILVAPTGSGKTVMAVDIVKRLQLPTLWVVHRRELVEQAVQHLVAVGCDPGYIMAGQKYVPGRLIYVASKDTLVRRGLPFESGIAVIDEAHHSSAKTYAVVTKSPLKLFGLTATPFRLDGKPLGEVFGHLVIARRVRDLINEKWLIDPRVYVAAQPNLKKIRKVAGDYNERQLAERCNTKELRGQVVASWLKHGQNRPTIVYTVDVAHAIDLANEFESAGIPAKHVSGSMSTDERTKNIVALRNGEITVLTNCMILTEGWDMPHLSCMVAARPTLSLALHLQMCGRIMRPSEGKTDAIILDHAGNTERLGLVDQNVDYSLTAKVTEKRAYHERQRKEYVCPSCAVLLRNRENPCPYCGHQRRVNIVETSSEMVPFRGTNIPASSIPFVDRLARFTTWVQRYGLGRAKKAYHDFFGEWPVIVEGRMVDPSNASDETKYKVYVQFCKMGDAKNRNGTGMGYGLFLKTFGYKPPWAWKVRYESERASSASQKSFPPW